jgi:pyridoxal 5'-phosphate synthase pdxT subunit
VSGAGPAVGVLALQGDVAEHLAALEQAGAAGVPVRRPGELAGAAALVIPGGESTTMWKLLTVFDLLDPLRKRIADGMPVFGSCAGMILLASQLVERASGQDTLGAIDMTVRRNAFGRQAQSFESEVTLHGQGLNGGPPFRAVFIRSPWVEQHGPEVQVLATEPRAGKVVAVRQGRALATAFHPELTPDRRIHKLFVDIVAEST